MTYRKRKSVLGLEPVRNQSKASLVLRDPFLGVHHQLSKEERQMVDEWRKRALVSRIHEAQAVDAGGLIAHLADHTSELFVEEVCALDALVESNQAGNDPYVTEFIHRQKQVLAGSLEDITLVTVDHITAQLRRVMTLPENDEERRGFFARLFGG
jgi:hypothetical protein